MPELANRKRFEREMQQAFKDWGKGRLEMLLKLMGAPPNPDNVPESFWRMAGQELRLRLEPLLKDVYLNAAQQLLTEAPITIDWTLANRNAAMWAKQYSFQLVRNINSTTQQRLQDIFSGFFTDRGKTVGDLRKLIAAEVDDLRVRMRDGSTRIMTSAERAKLIATTEVTRASVEGEKAIIKEIESAGIEMVAIWETQRDAKVCPICRPRQGKAQGDGWTNPPPAHPGCFCNLRYEPASMRT